MTRTKQIKAAIGVLFSAFIVAAPASAGNITVVRDVSARNPAPLPVKSITVVRDVSARDAIVRPVAPIRVVRDTPARDAARAARAGAKAIAYFKTMERPTFRQTSGDAAIR